eukprot:13935249-Alexandrium_andersonii.AAC.1
MRELAEKAGFWPSNSQGLRGLRIRGLWIGIRCPAISRLRAPSRPAFVSGFGICAVSYTHLTLPTICSV